MNCPVCNTVLTEQLLCPLCGHDESCEYRNHPTLFPLSEEQRSAVRTRSGSAQAQSGEYSWSKAKSGETKRTYVGKRAEEAAQDGAYAWSKAKTGETKKTYVGNRAEEAAQDSTYAWSKAKTGETKKTYITRSKRSASSKPESPLFELPRLTSDLVLLPGNPDLQRLYETMKGKPKGPASVKETPVLGLIASHTAYNGEIVITDHHVYINAYNSARRYITGYAFSNMRLQMNKVYEQSDRKNTIWVCAFYGASGLHTEAVYVHTVSEEAAERMLSILNELILSRKKEKK